jgi:WD40 repeat protein
MMIRLFIVMIVVGFFSTSLLSQTPKTSTKTLPIAEIAYSPDGKLLVAILGGKNQSSRVLLWDLATSQVVQNVSASAPVNGISFAPDSKLLAVASGTKAQLLDTKTGKVTIELDHPKGVRAVAFGPTNRLATSCADNRVRIWDTDTKKEIVQTEVTREPVAKLAFSPNGKWVMGVDNRNWLQWNAKDGKQRIFDSKEDWRVVEGVAFSADGEWAIRCIGNDGALVVANADTGVIRSTKKFPGGIDFFTYSPTSGVYAASYTFGDSSGQRVYVGQVRLTPLTEAEQKEVDSLMIKLDDELIVVRESASKDLLQLGPMIEPTLAKASKASPSAEVRLRSRKIKEQLMNRVDELPVPVGGISSLGISMDGKTIAIGGRDGIVRLADSKTGKMKTELKIASK